MKITKGTPVHHGPSLCRSCRYSQIMVGETIDQEWILCDKLGEPYNRITFKVVECNRYQNKATPTLQAMQSIAWELRTDKKGGQIGFLSPLEALRRKADVADLPWLDDGD